MSLHDPVYQSDHAATEEVKDPHQEHEIFRPGTADSSTSAASQRPFTCADSAHSVNLAARTSSQPQADIGQGSVTGTVLNILLKTNWGDASYIGLTGITLLKRDKPVTLRHDQLIVSQSSSETTHLNDSKKLLKKHHNNLTTDPTQMWLCPSQLPDGSCASLTFRLDQPTSLRGLRVWNYNASLDDTYKGVSYDDYDARHDVWELL